MIIKKLLKNLNYKKKFWKNLMSQELTKRILSSIILIPITLFFINKRIFFIYYFFIDLFFVTIYEWHMMSKKKKYRIFGFIFLFLSFYTIYN
jgi:phosphatidate cytidylyltransferase